MPKLLLQSLLVWALVSSQTVLLAQDENPTAVIKLGRNFATGSERFKRILDFILESSGGTIHVQNLTVDGKEREYLLFVPPSQEGDDEPKPLLMYLHGAQPLPAPARLGRNEISFLRMAAVRKLVAVFPRALPNFSKSRLVWNPRIPGGNRNDYDDVKFLTTVVSQAGQLTKVDPTHVYGIGFSAGALMCHRLVLKTPQTFAAFVPMYFNLPAYYAKRFGEEQTAISVFTIAGDQDPGFGGIEEIPGRRFEVLSFERTVAEYVKPNKINGEPKTSTLTDKDPDDGSTILSARYPPGTNGFSIQSWVVQGGGHQLPGVRDPRTSNRDVSLTDEIWDFLRSCPRRLPNHDARP